MNLTTTSLSHLGIVAGIFDVLGTVELINTCMPKNRSHHLSYSTVIKAMCLNGFSVAFQIYRVSKSYLIFEVR